MRKEFISDDIGDVSGSGYQVMDPMGLVACVSETGSEVTVGGVPLKSDHLRMKMKESDKLHVEFISLFLKALGYFIL